MKNKYYVLIVIFLIIKCSFNQLIICSYTDGNGNKYLFKISEYNYIEYNPITPAKSSSGVYSGGKYVKMKINQPQYDNLILYIKNAIKNKDIQIKNRLLGSGLIITEKNKIKIKYIIKSNSKEKLIIEKYLKKLINKSI